MECVSITQLFANVVSDLKGISFLRLMVIVDRFFPRLLELSTWLSLAVALGIFGAAAKSKAQERGAPSLLLPVEFEPDAKVKADLVFLCDDQLQGRGIGTEGIDIAANYIAESFAQSGLRVDLFAGTPFQTFEIPVTATIGPAKDNRLSFVPIDPAADARRVPLIEGVFDQTFRPMAIGDSGELDAELVFAGYGITAPEYDYDDYAKIDARGRVVVIVRKEPPTTAGDRRFEGTKNSRYAYFETKLKNASDHGAVAVLLVNDTDSIRDAERRFDARIADEMRQRDKLKDQIASIPAEVVNTRAMLEKKQETIATMINDLRRRKGSVNDGLMELIEAGEKPIVAGMPVISLSRLVANQLLRAAGFESVDETCKRIDRTLRPSSTVLAHRVTLQTSLNATNASSSNVVAVLDGKGDLAEQTVIVGAHYDHVGMGGFGSLAPGTVAVHNGADDNASGTAALLSSVSRIRDRLQDASSHRRVLFIAFTGEERGLLGSEYYVTHPRFPLESTVGMINLDMVGRLRDNDLTVYGTGTAREMESIVEAANQETKFKLFKVPSGFGPSDHQSFYTRNIPVLFFFTGLHNDYHRPSDDFDKINLNGLTRITDITSGVAVELASRSDRPQYVATDRNVSIRWQATAYLGVQLRDLNDGKGVLISAVTSGGAAEKAGVRMGDRIQKLGEASPRSVSEVLEIIRARDADEPLRIELQRGVNTVVVTAILETRPG
jgi:hypothetical protein